MMYRGKVVYFSADSKTIDKLFEINRICGDIWNQCLLEAKKHHKSHGKWINKTKLQQQLKNNYPLHSQTIQAVAHKYLYSRDNTHKAKLKGITTARYPYRRKRHFNAKWVDKAFTVTGSKIKLSMGAKRESLFVYTKNLPIGDIKEVELCYDNGLYLSVSYDGGKEALLPTGTQEAGVDMGEIHTFASVSENGESIIVSGRKLRSIHHFRNKKTAELQKLMSKCKKGSRQWKKYHRAKRFILSKSNKQLKDIRHKITKNFVNWCVDNDVHTVQVGDIRNIAKDSKKKRKLNRANRQKMSNWQVGKIIDYLTYKANAEGIKVNLVNEAYTTQTCPVCYKKKKPQGRNYACDCGYKQHRDIHSAGNILTKEIHGKMFPVKMNAEPKYLRVA